MSQRLSVEERRGFARYARELVSPGSQTEAKDLARVAAGKRGPFADITPAEPALGSLDERLAIIVKRQGGRVGPIRLSAAERAELAAYQGAYEEQELAA